MVQLTVEEQNWLKDNHPEMVYDAEKLTISGLFRLDHSYKNNNIRATFEIKIDLYKSPSRQKYPVIYNTDGQIKRIAKKKKLPFEDVHIYDSNSLCLGLPERFSEYYPEGLTLQGIFKHLSEHLYWVAYFDRYNKAPWEAEKHGNAASTDYQVEKAIERKDIEQLRNLYRKCCGRGIAIQKLRNYLNDTQLTMKLKKRLLSHGHANS